jgi:hypothetical protein
MYFASQCLFIFAPLSCDHLVGLLVVILDFHCCHLFYLLLFVGIAYWSLCYGFPFIIVVFLSVFLDCDRLVCFLIMVISVHCHHLFIPLGCDSWCSLWLRSSLLLIMIALLVDFGNDIHGLNSKVTIYKKGHEHLKPIGIIYIF